MKTAEQPGYTFALVSDIHIDREGGGSRAYYRMGEQNFADMLRLCRTWGVDFVLSAGDQITDAQGVEDEWRAYRDIIKESGISVPIFAALGNHETRSAEYGADRSDLIRRFADATRGDRAFGAQDIDSPYYAFSEPIYGDRFIIMALEGGMMTPFVDEFSPAQLDWVEQELDAAQQNGRRVFLVQHATVRGYGVGDDIRTPAYAGSLNVGEAFPGNTRFAELTRRYRDIIWLSGHSHVDLCDGVNYSDMDGAACRMVHIPALCGTTRLVRSGGTAQIDRTFRPNTAQGYLVRVYADRVTFTGVNFNTADTYPEYSFTILYNSKTRR